MKRNRSNIVSIMKEKGVRPLFRRGSFGAMSPRLAPDAVRGMLKARDPFELIRWLAYSQPDPRKALAELVQNSLDAGATVVRITRFTEGGRPAVRIFDDGQGV